MGFKRSRVRIPAARLSPSVQERVDEFRQFIAVAALENCAGRNIRFPQPLTEHGKIFQFESHFRDRVAGVGIEARGHEEKIWLEGKKLVKRAPRLRNVVRPWGSWWDGKIMNVGKRPGPGAGIPGKLVNRSKSDPRIGRDNLFGAVAVMRIEIPNGDPSGATRQRIERGHGDVVEIAKSHGAVARRMMAGRTHKAEGEIVVHRLVRNFDGRAGGPRSVPEDVRMRGGVGIEVHGRILHPVEMFSTVSTQQHFVSGRDGLSPFPIRMPGFEPRNCFPNPVRALWVPRGRVFHAS